MMYRAETPSMITRSEEIIILYAIRQSNRNKI